MPALFGGVDPSGTTSSSTDARAHAAQGRLDTHLHNITYQDDSITKKK